MNQLVRNVTIVLATLSGIFVLCEIREVVIMFVISLAVAAAVRPLVEALVVHRWPRTVALLVTYLTGVTILVGIVYLAAGSFVDELRAAVSSLASLYQRTTASWPQGTALEQWLAHRLPAPNEIPQALTGEHGIVLAQAAVGVTWNLFENVVRLVLTIVLSLYWSLDRVHFERLWLSLVPADRRIEVREAWHNIESGVGAYLRSEVVQGALAGLLLASGYHALGLRYPTLLATIGALAWLIPWVGALLALVPAFLVGWESEVGGAIGAGVYALAVFVLLEFFVEPRFFNRRRYNSLLVALVTLAMASELGLVGLLAGPPLAVTIQIFCEHSLRRPARISPDLTLDIAALKARLEQTLELMGTSEAAPPPEALSMLERLRVLIDDAEGALDQEIRAPAA